MRLKIAGLAVTDIVARLRIYAAPTSTSMSRGPRRALRRRDPVQAEAARCRICRLDDAEIVRSTGTKPIEIRRIVQRALKPAGGCCFQSSRQPSG